MVTGRKKVLEALQGGKQIDRVFIDRASKGKDIEEIRITCQQNLIPVSYVPLAKLDAFHVTGHEGCIAQIARVHYLPLQDVITREVESGEAPFLLILDGITDIRNIGGIARTAYCCGVHAIIIPDRGVGALNEDAILTSAGALEKIAVCRVNSLLNAVDELHLNGIKVFAADMRAEKNFSESDFTEPLALVIGSEEKGIYPALMKICDKKIKIPMAGGFESLNVSVAAGIILYEVMKQRTGI